MDGERVNERGLILHRGKGGAFACEARPRLERGARGGGEQQPPRRLPLSRPFSQLNQSAALLPPVPRAGSGRRASACAFFAARPNGVFSAALARASAAAAACARASLASARSASVSGRRLMSEGWGRGGWAGRARGTSARARGRQARLSRASDTSLPTAPLGRRAAGGRPAAAREDGAHREAGGAAARAPVAGRWVRVGRAGARCGRRRRRQHSGKAGPAPARFARRAHSRARRRARLTRQRAPIELRRATPRTRPVAVPEPATAGRAAAHGRRPPPAHAPADGGDPW